MSSKRVQQVYRPVPITGASGTGGVDRYRHRTPSEVVADGYMAITQVAALNAVTQLGMESVRQCGAKAQEVLAEHPNLEAPLTGLLFNHARLLASVQNSVADNDRRV